MLAEGGVLRGTLLEVVGWVGEDGCIPRRRVSSSWEDLPPAKRWTCIPPWVQGWRAHLVILLGQDGLGSFGWLQLFLPCLLSVLSCVSLCEHGCSYPPPPPPSPDPVLPFQASKAWRKNKMDESKHEIHSQVDAITAGTASVVNLTAGVWRVEEEGYPICRRLGLSCLAESHGSCPPSETGGANLLQLELNQPQMLLTYL